MAGEEEAGVEGEMIARAQKEALIRGVEILDKVLEPQGFHFKFSGEGRGSGGPFAWGVFQRHDRKLELHYRYSLGLVRYHIGNASLDHETYMRLLGVYGRNLYPDFPGKPLDSFEHLAFDIQEFCSDFTSGDGGQFRMLAADLAENPEKFKGMP